MQTSNTSPSLKNQRLDRAAAAMVDAISTTAFGGPNAAAKRAEFRKLAAGIEQRALVRLAAQKLAVEVKADPVDAERLLWSHVERFFGWPDPARVPCWGAA